MDLEQTADRFAGLALACVAREYPHASVLVVTCDSDARPPRILHPAFHGCFDWHSSVHSHWLLARFARLFPRAARAEAARAALTRSLDAANIAVELATFEGEGRAGLERPYGLAWLLTLALELREWTVGAPDDAAVAGVLSALAPLERLAARRLGQWLPKLSHPIRSGEHPQSAFSMGLALDWARRAGAGDLERVATSRARDFHLGDRDAPLAYEPSGHDFLSPCLAEADLMRRVLGPAEMAAWLDRFIPSIPSDGAAGWLAPVLAPDPTDGKLAHLDGLNLSRAWMLEGIASALPPDDHRLPSLHATAAAHRTAGLAAAVRAAHYAGAHWLGSFAMYLITGRGLPGSR